MSDIAAPGTDLTRIAASPDSIRMLTSSVAVASKPLLAIEPAALRALSNITNGRIAAQPTSYLVPVSQQPATGAAGSGVASVMVDASNATTRRFPWPTTCPYCSLANSKCTCCCLSLLIAIDNIKVMNHSDTSAHRAGVSGNTYHSVCDPVANDNDNDNYGTLIFDGQGRICGCGAVADSLFGAGQRRITGQLIFDFIPDIHFGTNPPGYHSISLDALCARSDWQHCEAMDIFGRGFNVEVRVSRRMTNGNEVFVLNFHRPGVPLFARMDSA